LSDLKVTTISDLAGTGPVTLTKQSAAKAWVNFDGTGTVAIRDSLNVSSITDNGTGDYTDNLTNSFTNTNWSLQGSSGDNSGVLSFSVFYDYTRSVSSQRMLYVKYDTGAAYDNAVQEQLFHGDLA
jgi:hypothetical protein